MFRTWVFHWVKERKLCTSSLLPTPTPFPDCLHLSSISVIKHWPQATWKGKALTGLHILITLHHWGKPRQEVKLKLQRKAAYWLTHGLLSDFLYTPWPPAQGQHHHSWLGLPHQPSTKKVSPQTCTQAKLMGSLFPEDKTRPVHWLRTWCGRPSHACLSWWDGPRLFWNHEKKHGLPILSCLFWLFCRDK